MRGAPVARFEVFGYLLLVCVNLGCLSPFSLPQNAPKGKRNGTYGAPVEGIISVKKMPSVFHGLGSRMKGEMGRLCK